MIQLAVIKTDGRPPGWYNQGQPAKQVIEPALFLFGMNGRQDVSQFTFGDCSPEQMPGQAGEEQQATQMTCLLQLTQPQVLGVLYVLKGGSDTPALAVAGDQATPADLMVVGQQKPLLLGLGWQIRDNQPPVCTLVFNGQVIAVDLTQGDVPAPGNDHLLVDLSAKQEQAAILLAELH